MNKQKQLRNWRQWGIAVFWILISRIWLFAPDLLKMVGRGDFDSYSIYSCFYIPLWVWIGYYILDGDFHEKWCNKKIEIFELVFLGVLQMISGIVLLTKDIGYWPFIWECFGMAVLSILWAASIWNLRLVSTGEIVLYIYIGTTFLLALANIGYYTGSGFAVFLPFFLFFVGEEKRQQ